MTESVPTCPECASEFTYEQGALLVCSMCAHEWNPDEPAQTQDAPRVVRDAVGNVLSDGDTVTVVKDLKVGSSAIKVGTRVRNIRLIEDGVGDHDIDCKVDGFGPMQLKSSVVKKAT